MPVWRLIIEDGVSAAYGLAADECITLRAGQGISPPTLRLYTYRSHCALVGRFQNVHSEVAVEYCREHDIQINRRPTGGGAILMGADQLGVALMLPRRDRAVYGRARQLMALFSRGLVQAMAELGIPAAFRHKNDLEVEGRKLAGLGLYRHPHGGLLFHASLLVDMDIPLMLRVLRTPFEKITDKEINTVEQRIVTMKQLLGTRLAMEEVRRRVAAGYARAFGIRLQPAAFTPDEKSAIKTLETRKYRSPDWIFQPGSTPDRTGWVTTKTRAGLLQVGVSLSGGMIKAVVIRGDFFAAEHVLADLEGRLRWQPADPRRIATVLQEVYSQRGGELALPAPVLRDAIVRAIQQSDLPVSQNGERPYGCFVSPGGTCH